MSTMPELGFHSLTEEVSTTCPVDGTVPDWLSGTLVRNGPGAFEMAGDSVDHWFDGVAMLRAFSFDGGKVTYRNRFLRTDAYRSARDGSFEPGFATGETTLRDRLWSFLFEDPYDNANVIVERAGDRYLAVTETPRWVAFDPVTLETRGHVQYDGPAPSGQLTCAHFQRDPATDELVTFDVEFGRTCHYHVYAMADPISRRHVCSVTVDRPAYMHSFALTPDYVVLTEFPLVVDPMDFLRPGRQGPFIETFRWEPDRGTRFLVLDRASGETVASVRTTALFGFHHVNAYEDGDDVVVDLETVPDAASLGALTLDRLRAGDLDVFAGALERFRVSLADQPSISRREIHPGGTALPTVSPAVWLSPHRYVYAQGTDQPVTDWPRRVLKVDVETGTETVYDAGDGYVSEPLFVPRPDGTAEDDGVVLVVVLDASAARSRLLILDGGTLDELARATLPHALPFDFHGRYFPEVG